MKRHFFRTFSGRFMLIISTLILFLGLSICTFCFWLFQQNLTETMIQETETNLEFLVQKVNSHMSNITSFSTLCCNNNEISRFLLTTKDSEQYNSITAKAVNYFNREYDNSDSKQYIQRTIIGSFIKDDYLQIVSPFHSVDRPMSTLVKQIPYFYDYINNKPLDEYDFELRDSTFPSSNKQMIPMIQKIEYPYDSNNLGYIYNEVSVSMFTDAMNGYMNPGITSIYVTIGGKTYTVYADDPNTLTVVDSSMAYTDDTSHNFILQDSKLSIVQTDHGKRKLVTRPLDMHNCYISAELSITASLQMLHKYIVITVAIIAFILFSGVIAISLSYQFFMRPVHQLHARIRQISNGDFEPDPDIEWDNEIGDIGHLINNLGVNIDELLKNRLKDECEKKDYEYKMLQSQINPHFLYNTLNSIKWMAVVQHADGISEMTTSLSRLLKNISKGRNTLVTIDDELILLQEYFTIEKYRYGGAIDLEYQIEDSAIRKNKILRFTLQPIVENAIFHGIEPKGAAGKITVHIFYDQNNTRIDITDDGIGMSEERINHILNEDNLDDSTFFKGMGISSVNKMLKYTFGEEYGIVINSELNVYTTVTVLLPISNLERSLDCHETTDR